MSNYTHFSSLGYQHIDHQALARGTINPLGRMSPDDIEQKAREEQEQRQREDQERIEQERVRRKRANLEGFRDKFGGKMETRSASGFINTAGTSIVDFTEKSLQDLVDTLATNSKTIVWFYAPWCGHCKTFTQTFLDVEEKLRDKVNFIMVNGDRNSDASRNYEILGFPTFKFFTATNSKGIEYNGPRTAAGLLSFLQSQ